MPLTGQSPTVLHLLQNLSLIFLSTLFIPLCTTIALFSKTISPFTKTTKHIARHRKWRASSSSTFRPRIILVTGVGMSKGLVLARAFYRAGHRVIGADFEPYGVPVSGRFSVSLEKFYRLSKPASGAGGAEKYISDLVEIVKREKVEVWVSCSGVASAIEDALAAEAVERLTGCRAIQFGRELTETLHEKHAFIENTRKLGLNVPETHLITSVQEAMDFLYPASHMKTSDPGHVQKKYIMKSVGLDDSIRADMTLLPRSSISETRNYLSRLRPSPSRPFVLQQFISGPEYCTHALIIRGQVLAFVACPSAELLMHYRPLPSTSLLSRAMLTYTQQYCQRMGPSMTGHFSIDFLLDETDTNPEKDLLQKIYPIECNPRAHTAVVLFADDSEELAEAYLRILPDHEAGTPSHLPGHRELSKPMPSIVMPSTSSSYYWIGHDIVTRMILPPFQFLSGKINIWTLLASWVEFVEHVLFWRDGTFEIWDPWPAWFLYCVYWPGMFSASLVTGRWWSRCNVSTTKMFAC
jgi:hypothetical protein